MAQGRAGALPPGVGAEITPFEPDQGNTCAGNGLLPLFLFAFLRSSPSPCRLDQAQQVATPSEDMAPSSLRRCRRPPAIAGLALLLLAVAGGGRARRLLAVAALVTMGRQLAPLAARPLAGARPAAGAAWRGISANDGPGCRAQRGLAASFQRAAAGAGEGRLSQGIALLLVVATAATFGMEAANLGHVPAAADATAARGTHYVSGLCWSAVAIVAKPVTSALRKSLAGCKEAVGHAEQVGVASLLQGLAAMVFCILSTPSRQLLQPPPAAFWALMATSSVMNAGIRTFETRAYAIGELSLCAPFLAFDPVMQLAVGALVAPFVCSLLGVSCDEGVVFTARHAFAVVSIAQGMFALSCVSSRGQASAKALAGGTPAGGPLRLPRGAWLIILNCVLYAFTYRLDARACNLATSTFYFACCRLLMAATCLGGSLLRRKGPGERGVDLQRLAPFLRPQVALRVLAVVLVDGFYMLSMYRAVSLISPVFVSAVKRGGGVLVSALLGAMAFGEKLEGRWTPLLTVAVGVTLLCL
uniref:Uncharacterized protein n=1 Tax=Alexandrium monilatum TaxID=311494 RepID=A0A7S4RR09_9DINO